MPQFIGSLLVSTQAAPHIIWLLAQPQVPELHCCVAGQALLQLPQLATSLLVLTQVPLQNVSPVGQLSILDVTARR